MNVKNACTGQVFCGLCAVCIAFMVVGCDDQQYEHDTRSKNFTSLAECLRGIQSDSGLNLNVVTNTPSQVSGSLVGERGFFNCERRTTGTQGTFYEGTYTVSTVVTPIKAEPVPPAPTPTVPKDQPPPTSIVLKDPSDNQNPTLPTSILSDEMRELEKKKEQGLISDEEYDVAKKVLQN